MFGLLGWALGTVLVPQARVGHYFKWVGQSPEWVGHGLLGLGIEPPLTGRQMVEFQTPEDGCSNRKTSDGRHILDDVPERVAGMMLMNADGGDQAGRQHEPADQGMAGPDHATLGTP